MCEISLIEVGVRYRVGGIEPAGKHCSSGPTVVIPSLGEVIAGGEVIEQKQRDQEWGLV